MTWIIYAARLMFAASGAAVLLQLVPDTLHSVWLARIGWAATLFCLSDVVSMPARTLHPGMAGLVRFVGRCLGLVVLLTAGLHYCRVGPDIWARLDFAELLWAYATGAWLVLRLTRMTSMPILDAEAAVAASVAEFGEGHSQTGALRNALALAYRKAGRKVKAEEEFDAALESYRASSEPRGNGLAIVLANKAALLAEVERYSDSEHSYLTALRLKEELFGKDSPRLALTLCGLGVLYFKWRSFGKAEHYLARALVLAEKDPEQAGCSPDPIACDLGDVRAALESQRYLTERAQ